MIHNKQDKLIFKVVIDWKRHLSEKQLAYPT